jgi:hypothetical protein
MVQNSKGCPPVDVPARHMPHYLQQTCLLTQQSLVDDYALDLAIVEELFLSNMCLDGVGV